MMNWVCTKSIIFLFSLLVFIACRNEPAGELKQVNETIIEDATVTVQLRALPQGLNPWLTASSYSIHVYNHFFPPLLKYDPVTFELVPVLAKARPEIKEISEGVHAGKTRITYEIREEAVWDNGSPITGEDVVFTMKALHNPKVKEPGYRSYFDFMGDMEVDANNPKKFSFIANEKNFLMEYASANICLS